jgi:hypothetical protein
MVESGPDRATALPTAPRVVGQRPGGESLRDDPVVVRDDPQVVRDPGDRIATGPVRVVYIGGVGRSGSTLLDRMLGQLPHCCSLGETSVYIWRRSVQLNWKCSCGVPFWDCPFWHRVGERAFGGWDAVDVEEVLALREAVDKTKYIPLLASPRQPKAFAEKLDRYAEIVGRLYAAIAEVSGRRVLIDSGKFPSTPYLLRRVPGLELTVVHLVRNPCAVAHSWSRGKISSVAGIEDRSTTMMKWAPKRVARRYLTINPMVEALSLLRVPTVRMRYEDLIVRPREEVRRLAPLLPFPLDDDALRFIGDGSVELGVTHNNGGNLNRFRTGSVPLRLDEEWRTAMPAADRQMIERLTLPMRLRYGYR